MVLHFTRVAATRRAKTTAQERVHVCSSDYARHSYFDERFQLKVAHPSSMRATLPLQRCKESDHAAQAVPDARVK